MSNAQIIAIAVLALPALAFVLWPILRRNSASGILAVSDDRREELAEEKRALYRALKELEFDHQSGHLSEDDYAGLRDRYEARAAELLKELDRLEAARPKIERRTAPVASITGPPRAWTRSPVTLGIGAVVLVLFGLTLGLGVARYTAPDTQGRAPGLSPARPDAFAPGLTPDTEGGAPGLAPARPGGSGSVPPEMLSGMLEAARQSLFAGRYQEAIAAYQAVLKRDPKNVDALTHLGLIVAIGGHSDAALESLGKALALDPNYAPAHLYRGQILYEVKQDYRGAIRAWEKYLALVPQGEEHARVSRLIQEAKARLAERPK